MTKEDLMRRAIALSTEGMHNGHGGPFGAVVAHNGVIVSEGFNRVLSSLDPTAHAEIVAIRKAASAMGRFSLAGCELYTSCEPCPMCLGAIYWSRIDRVYFGNGRADAAAIGFDDEFFYQELALPFSGRKLPMIPLLADEAHPAFAEWSANPNKTRY